MKDRDRRYVAAVLTLALVAGAFVGCQETASEGRPVAIEKIGERDGVKLYRFGQNGYIHYYAVGPDGRPVGVE